MLLRIITALVIAYNKGVAAAQGDPTESFGPPPTASERHSSI